MTKIARTRTCEIAARVLATLGVLLGSTVISIDAGAGFVGGGLAVGTVDPGPPGCTAFITQQLGSDPTTPTSMSGSLTSPPCDFVDPTFGHTTGHGDVRSFVDYGVIKTIGHATSSGAVGFGFASTGLVFKDMVTFMPGDPVLIGQAATYNARMQLQALLTGQAEWTLTVTGAVPDTFSGAWDGVESGGLDCSSPCIFDLALGMTFGTPTLLQVNLMADTVAVGVNRHFSSSFDLSTSVYWDGIQSVTVNGEPVAFTLESTSGHDWTQSSAPTSNGSAPEPGSLALVALGLAGLGFARCQRVSGIAPMHDESKRPRTHRRQSAFARSIDCSGSFTPIETEVPAGGSTIHRCPSRLVGGNAQFSGRSRRHRGGL